MADNIIYPPVNVPLREPRNQDFISRPWSDWLREVQKNINGNLQSVAVIDIDNPSTELLLLSGEKTGDILVAYQIVDGENIFTMYGWDAESGLSADGAFVVPGSKGTWIAFSGRFSNFAPKINSLTPSRLTWSDADKELMSVSDLTAWISGTANRTTITDNGAGGVTVDVVSIVTVAENAPSSPMVGDVWVDI